MGFLLGAFGKQMAGKRLRALQARMMNVQSRLRRATRDIEARERYWSRVEKDNKNMMTMTLNAASIGMQKALQASVFGDIAANIKAKIDNNEITLPENTSVDFDALNKGDWGQLAKLGVDSSLYSEMLTNSRTQATQTQQFLQAAMQQQMALQENMIEAAKEADLMGLKDLEDDLQTEKDSLESQIQLAQADYDGCKEMEKAGAKNMVPQYTGQG